MAVVSGKENDGKHLDPGIVEPKALAGWQPRSPLCGSLAKQIVMLMKRPIREDTPCAPVLKDSTTGEKQPDAKRPPEHWGPLGFFHDNRREGSRIPHISQRLLCWCFLRA